jgi:DNA-binding transcriptional LysR family regulator
MTRPTFEPERRRARRLTARDLRILSVTVRCGSMAKAARELGMTQPSVSEAISTLEAVLRVRLLDRSTRGVEPTLYAEALINRGRIIFDELEQAIRDVEFLSNPGVGEVSVGCPESLAAGFVPAVIESFSRQYPRVTVHVVPAEPATLQFRELRERSVDLMIGRILEQFPGNDLRADVLFNDRCVVLAGTCSHLADRRHIALAELTKERWIHLPPINPISLLVAEAFRSKGLEVPRESVRSFSLHVRNHLLAGGRFITTSWASMLKFNSKQWGLKALPVDLGIPPVPVAAIMLKNRTLSPVVERFVEHAKTVGKRL